MYSLLSSLNGYGGTFYCLKTMLIIMVALKRRYNFTRWYPLPRTVTWPRDLPLSGAGTGADLQREQRPSLRLPPSALTADPAFGTGWACLQSQCSAAQRAVVHSPVLGRSYLKLLLSNRWAVPEHHLPRCPILESRSCWEGTRCAWPLIATVFGHTRCAGCWGRPQQSGLAVCH